VRDFLKQRRQNLITLLMLAPGLAGFFGLFFYPMLVTVALSLRPEGQSSGWTIENYVNFLNDPHGRDVILLTFTIAISATALSILFSIPLALILREKFRGHRFFRLLMIIPRVVPGLIGALGLMLLFGSRGWFNLFLIRFVPFIKGPIRVVHTLHGLIIFYLWLYFPFTCLTSLSALEALDPAVEEAAMVAGANRWQVLRHIVLPLIMPGVLAGSVLTFMACFGAFSVPLLTGGNYRPLSVTIYKQIEVFIPARWSTASAIAVIMAALQVAFLSLYMRILRRPMA